MNGDILSYFEPIEPAMDVLRNIILDPKWLLSLRYYVRFRFDYGYFILQSV